MSDQSYANQLATPALRKAMDEAEEEMRTPEGRWRLMVDPDHSKRAKMMKLMMKTAQSNPPKAAK